MDELDIMDKVDNFFEALEKAGIEVTEGQTAIVCNDGVVLVDIDDTGACDVIFCNSKIEFNYSMNITPDDVEAFKTVAGTLVETEE